MNSGLTQYRVRAFAINSAGHIFAGTVSGTRGGGGKVFRSTDNGSNWSGVNTGLVGNVSALVINSAGHIFAGTSQIRDVEGEYYGGGVFRCTDNGNTWSAMNTGLTNLNVRALAINGLGHIFAATAGGVFRSTDNGDSWSPINTGLITLNVRALAINSAGHIFAGTLGGGMFRSTDNGDSWSPTNAGLANLNVQALAINSAGYILAGTQGDGMFQSTDNGDTWSQIGLTNTSVLALAINSTGHIFTGSVNRGVFRSTDNGGTWNTINTGLACSLVSKLAINNEGDIFAAADDQGVFRTSDNGDTWNQTGLTNPNVWSLAINSSGHVFAGTDSGVFRSIDNGDTWSLIGLTNNGIAALTFSNTGHIFAGTWEGGMFRSTDNGKSWSPINNGLTNLNVQALTINSLGHIFAGTLGGGIFRSTDNGDSWSPTNAGITNFNVYALAINSAGHIFAGTWNDGVFRSNDNGDTWSRTGLLYSAVSALAINKAGHIFAGAYSTSYSGGAFLSTDNGDTWSSINTGLINGDVRALVINSAGHIFAGTFGGGVFRSRGGYEGSFTTYNLNMLSLQRLGLFNPGSGMRPFLTIFSGDSSGSHLLSNTENDTIWSVSLLQPSQTSIHYAFGIDPDGDGINSSGEWVYELNGQAGGRSFVTPASGETILTPVYFDDLPPKTIDTSYAALVTRHFRPGDSPATAFDEGNSKTYVSSDFSALDQSSLVAVRRYAYGAGGQLPQGIVILSDDIHWGIEMTPAAADFVTRLTINYASMDSILDPAALRLLRRDGPEASWQLMPTILNQANKTVSTDSVTALGEWTLGFAYDARLVTFNLDARPLQRIGLFRPERGMRPLVSVFNGPKVGSTLLMDTDSDSIWSVQLAQPAFETIRYAFAIDPDGNGVNSQGEWVYELEGVTGGRSFAITTAGHVVLPPVSFDDSPFKAINSNYAALVTRPFLPGNSPATAFDEGNSKTYVSSDFSALDQSSLVAVRRYAYGAGGQLPQGIVILSDDIHWGIEMTPAAANFVTRLTISYASIDSILDPAALRLLRRDGPEASWQLMPTILNQANKTVSTDSVTALGEWTLGFAYDARLVTFNLDARPLQRIGLFRPERGMRPLVSVFNGPKVGNTLLMDADNDSIWSVQLAQPAFETIRYAFAIDPDGNGVNSQGEWVYELEGVTGGRSLAITTAGHVVLPPVSFDDSPFKAINSNYAALVTRPFLPGNSPATAFDEGNSKTYLALDFSALDQSSLVAVRRYAYGVGGQLPQGIVILSDAIHWGIAMTPAAANFVTRLTINYASMDSILDPAALRLLRRDGLGASWQLMPTILNQANKTVSTDSVTAFGEWTLGFTYDARLVTFNLDTRSLQRNGLFRPERGMRPLVSIFNGPKVGNTLLMDTDSDSIWSVQLAQPAFETIRYAFVIDPDGNGVNSQGEWVYELEGVTGGRSFAITTAGHLILPPVSFDDSPLKAVNSNYAALVPRPFLPGDTPATAFDEGNSKTYLSLDFSALDRSTLVSVRRYVGGTGGEPPVGIAVVAQNVYWVIESVPASAVFNTRLMVNYAPFNGIVDPKALRLLRRSGPGASWEVVPTEVHELAKTLIATNVTVLSEWTLGSTSTVNSLQPQVPGIAHQPNPIDGEVEVSNLPRLSWQPVELARSYDLYLWPAKQNMPAQPTAANFESAAYQVNTSLVYGATYNWRVLARNIDGETMGPVWRFTVRNLPDLQITEVQAPPEAHSGQTFSVSWVVRNAGQGPTNIPRWYDGVYLSANPIFNSQTATWLGNFENVSFLPVGESYSNTARLALPQSAIGEYHVFIVADDGKSLAESDEANNVGRNVSTTVVHLTSPPDLQITSLLAPDYAFSGDTINIAWTVQNRGTGRTVENDWFDAVYLSKDSVFNANAKPLGPYYKHVGNLDPDSFYSMSISIQLPQVILGQHFLFVVTDATKQVFEFALENNNARADTIDITLTPPPDLVVTEVAIPQNGMSGKPVAITWKVENLGPGVPFESTWIDRIYLSSSPTFTPDSAVALGSVAHFGSLEVGANYTVQRDFTIPNGTSGLRYVFVQTDGNGQVFEGGEYESNNFKRSAEQLNISLSPWPDLRVTSLQSADHATAGDEVKIDYTILNAGVRIKAPAIWIDAIYLSASEAWDSTRAILLKQIAKSAPLDSSGSYTETATIELATNLSGQYYLFIRSDVGNTVYEYTDEKNNSLRSKLITIQPYPAIDLAVTEVSLPDTGLSSQPVTLHWKVTNIGAARTLASSWSDSAYLSQDQVLNRHEDILVALVRRDQALGRGEGYVRDYSSNLPNGISGTYYLIVRNGLRDIDAENNTGISSTPIIIQLLPSPDLQVTNLAVPSPAQSGQPLKVRWTVQNMGIGATPGTSWYDGVYLSQNTTFDNSDSRLGTYQRDGALEPGYSYTDSLEVDIPIFASGTYYLLVQTDNRNDIYEHNAEENNTLNKAISLILPAPCDLVISSIAVPDSAQPGEEVTVSYTLKNQGMNSAVGQLQDAIYFSADESWDISDPLLGILKHTISMPPGALMKTQLKVNLAKTFLTDTEGNVTAELPGLMPGKYHAIVRTDIRNNFRESDDSNNILTSADSMKVDVPTLPLGVPLRGLLAQGQMLYFKTSVPANEHLQIILDSESSASFHEVFVAYDRIPSFSDFDFMHNHPFEADQEIAISDTKQGIYYILVHGNYVPNGPRLFTLHASLLQFHLMSTDLHEGGQGGKVTLKLKGAKLSRNVTAYLERQSSTYKALQVYFENSGTIYPTFDLVNARLGEYDIMILDTVSKAEDRLNASFRVVPPRQTSLEINVRMPSTVRPGLHFEIRIEYANGSDNDIENPLLVLRTIPDFQLDLPRYSVLPGGARAVRIETAEGPGAVLRPRASGVIHIPTLVPWNARGHTFLEVEVYPLQTAAPKWAVQDLFLIESLRANLDGKEVDLIPQIISAALASPEPSVTFPGGTTFTPTKSFPSLASDADNIIIHNTVVIPGVLSYQGNQCFAVLTSSDLNYYPETIGESDVLNIDFSSVIPPHAKVGDTGNLDYAIVQFLMPEDTSDIDSTFSRAFVSSEAQSLLPEDSSFRRISPQQTPSGGYGLGALPAARTRALSNLRVPKGKRPEMVIINGVPYGIIWEKHPDKDRVQAEIGAKWLEIAAHATTIAIFPPSGLWELIAHLGLVVVPIGIELPKLFEKNAMGDMTPDQPRLVEMFVEKPKQPCIVWIKESPSVVIRGGDLKKATGLSKESEGGGNTVVIGNQSCDWGMTGYEGIILYGQSEVITANDPNDIFGPAGYDEKKWVSINQLLEYTIHFENDPDIATAPAQVVTIKQQLNPNIDPRSFRLGTFGFGSFTFHVPANRSSYTKRLNVRDSLGVYVDVNAGIDITKNEAFWIFKSVDPATGETPTNPLAGFLAVNDSLHHGEGFVSYTVRPNTTSVSGDTVHAQARIVFDINDPLDTPRIFNTIDAGNPVSHINSYYKFIDSSSFEISWTGQDDVNGSGIQSYTIYVAEDTLAFRPWATDVTDTSLVFTGEMEKNYHFFSIAKDHVGNVEPMKNQAELIVSVEEKPVVPPHEFVLYQCYPNPFNPAANIKYGLSKPSRVKIIIYNMLGQQVRVLVDEEQPTGYHTVQWDGKSDGGYRVATGPYFCRMTAGEFTKTKKMMLIR